ncbi:MAG TPA: glycoside hydrolase family 16 protein [Chitinophagaceae bacterium]|nr:glycoside hydrolase family 16 protein [Chitinophagaceae bacterium]
MNKNILFAACMLILFLSCNNKEKMTEPAYQLVWADEFATSGQPDAAKWNYEVGGHGWGNQELQFYTDRRTENARVENGYLIIEARKENWQGMNYTSARLVTKGKAEWQYGRIEVKAKIPSGRGTWPAIWMLGATTPLNWPDDGEIDIMEHVGFNQGTVHASIHCKKYYHSIGTQKTATIPVPDCSDSFHVYATEWDKDSVRVSVDGNTYFRFANEHTGYEAWPFDNKMFLLLNIAVGGAWGGQQGVDDSIFPKKMEIDYVRVYQKK